MRFYLIPLTMVIIIALSVPGSAYSSYGDQIPGELNGACIVCHEDSNGGGTLNPYGVDYAAYKSVDDIASKDSDGDGVSNKAELDEGYLPGDANDFPEPESEGSPGFGIIGLTAGIIGALLIIKGRGR